jgi:membrane-bound ClpP family serine protease
MLTPPGSDEISPTNKDDSPFSELQSFVGEVGRSITDLRPGGTVEINGVPIDAVTDEGYLEAGISIRVIGIKQAQLLVRRYSR